MTNALLKKWQRLMTDPLSLESYENGTFTYVYRWSDAFVGVFETITARTHKLDGQDAPEEIKLVDHDDWAVVERVVLRDLHDDIYQTYVSDDASPHVTSMNPHRKAGQ